MTEWYKWLLLFFKKVDINKKESLRLRWKWINLNSMQICKQVPFTFLKYNTSDIFPSQKTADHMIRREDQRELQIVHSIFFSPSKVSSTLWYFSEFSFCFKNNCMQDCSVGRDTPLNVSDCGHQNQDPLFWQNICTHTRTLTAVLYCSSVNTQK